MTFSGGRVLALACGGVLALASPRAARAQDPVTQDRGTASRDEAERTGGWPANVPEFRWWEYVGTAGLLGGSIALRQTVDLSGRPTWSGGVLADEWVYDTFFVETPHRFRNWRKVGDVGYLSSFAWSAADPLIAGIAFDWWTGLQMLFMNVEAFAVYSTILHVSQVFLQRERPSTRECDDPELAAALGISCGTGDNVNRSFVGGHAGTVATAATLTCIHHIQLPLWGSPAADALPCITWTAMTAVVATSRTITGQHYLTDNLIGVGVGVMSGLVPWALHYAQPFWEHARGVGARPPPILPTMAMIVPYPQGLGVSVGGILY